MKPIFVLTTAIAVTSAVLNDDCSNLWRRWRQCPVPPPQLAGAKRLCFLDGKQFYILTLGTENGIAVDCGGEEPYMALTRCLNVTTLFGLGMRNCKYSNFSLKDYIGDKHTAFVEIIYNVALEELMDTDLVFSNLPTLRNVSIIGLRSTGLFNIKFDKLPYILLLNITNHNFTSFHRRPFRDLYDLEAISLRYGILEAIPEDLFFGLRNLRLLDLAWNRIKSFHPKTFKGLIHLLDLDLAGNAIDTLSADHFSDLKNLATLQIQDNRLVSLPPDLLRHIPTLVFLDVSHNTFEIPEGFLDNAIQLTKFVALNSSLNSLQETLFSKSKYLKGLFLSVNRLRSLPIGLFRNTENLLLLLLDANEIEYLTPGLFRRLFRLQTLSIMYNNLHLVSADTFVGLSSLNYLDLSNNKLVKVEDSAFDPLTNLQEIHLYSNPLAVLPSQAPFGQSRYLSVVNASNCQLKVLPDIDWFSGNLTYLDFSNNHISNVTLPVFTKNKTIVVLSGNNINTIKLNYTNVTNVSPFYLIRDNPLICDCELQDFLNFFHSAIQNNNSVFLDVYWLKCYTSEVKVISIWPPYKVCPLESDLCPLTCDCYVMTTKKAIIECANKDLASVPSTIPPETAVVHLQNNNFTELPSNNSNYWRNVEKLFLSNNSLQSLEGWPIPPKLKLLAVDGNFLSNLPSPLMAVVDSVPDFKIYLGNNSWRCDCDSVQFKRWFGKNKRKIPDADQTFCTRRSQENGTELNSLIGDTPIDIFCLEKTAPPTWQAATITIAVIVFLFIVAAIVYHRYNNTILSLLYSRNMYCFWWDKKYSGEEKTFDAFICYNSADHDITMEMIKELEPSYKLCVHERDWLPGFPISYHIVNSVQNSRRTLLLLSKSFLESIWFQVEFQTAYNQMLKDRIHRLVVILVEDLGDIGGLEEGLRHLLSTKTYLKWGEKWFWEKLKYALRRPGNQAEST